MLPILLPNFPCFHSKLTLDKVIDSILNFFGISSDLDETATGPHSDMYKISTAFYWGIQTDITFFCMNYTQAFFDTIEWAAQQDAITTAISPVKQNLNSLSKGAVKTIIPWGKWSDYEKVTMNGQEYAKVGDRRLYSRHAVDRMQPSGNRYGSSITQAGGDYGRSVAPQYVEDVISSVKPIVQENGNLKYVGGSLEVITNPQGAVVTVMTK